MKNFLLLISVFAFGFVKACEPKPVPFKKNIIYAEGLSFGNYYSLNYERIFCQKENYFLSWRAGGSILPRMGKIDYTIPAGAFINFGRSKHHLQFGMQFTFESYYRQGITFHSMAIDASFAPYPFDPRVNSIGALLNTGYRYQKPGGRITVQANLAAGFYQQFTIGHYFGIGANAGIGYCFGKTKTEEQK